MKTIKVIFLFVIFSGLVFFTNTPFCQVRILPLGNSLTDGDGEHNSYRKPLWHMLDSAGFNADFIGSKNLNGIHPNETGEVKMAWAWFNKLSEVLDTFQHQSRSYYISPLGSDAGPGTLSSPWKTIEKVNRMNFYPGDSILFQGNGVFYGNLIISGIKPNGKDTLITISSYGNGKAIIYGGKGNGILVDNCANMILQNLQITGAGRLSGNTGDGVIIRDCHDITVNGLEICGYQHSGLLVSGKGQNIHISGVYAHDNGFAGIHVFGQYPDKYLCKNLYIGHCIAENNPGDPTVLDNHSGNGILVGVCDSILIEYCEAFNNGWDMPRKGNGPVGIWAWHADHVIIQHCISHHNKTSTGSSDGGGFDLDGGVTNSVVQYCLTYANEGAGFGLFEYQGASVFENNSIRYNISINDGTNYGGASAAVWNGNPDPQKLRNLHFFNNVLYNDLPQGKAVVFWDNHYSGAVFSNNIFLTKGPAFSGPSANATWLGNAYWNLGNSFSLEGASSFEEWVALTGKEMLGGNVIGMNVDPMLYNPRPVSITNPEDLSYQSMKGFQLMPGSPLRDKGIDLTAIFGKDMGEKDFYGDTIPFHQTYDIGIHEYRNHPPVITSCPFTSVMAGNSYLYKLTVTDPNAGDKLKFEVDTLPQWLTFDDSSDILTGVPSMNDTGVFQIQINVSDGQLNSHQFYSLNVKDNNNPPSFVHIPDTTLNEKAAFHCKIEVSDPDTCDRIFLGIITKPAWLEFNPESWQLSGIVQPGKNDQDTVRMIASDGIDTVKHDFIITVIKVNHPPQITSAPLSIILTGEPYRYTLRALDFDPEDKLTFEAIVMPGWLHFSPSQGELFGIPATQDIGNNHVLLLAKDASSFAEQSFMIQVIEPGKAYIADPGFEMQDLLPPWEIWTDGGLVSIETIEIHNGVSSARLTGYYAYLRQLVAILPHHLYFLKVWIRTDNGESVWFGVKNYGGEEVSKYIQSPEWTEVEISFETGDNPSPAEIYLWKDSGEGSIFVDDFSIQTLNLPTIENPGFSTSDRLMFYPNPVLSAEKLTIEGKENFPAGQILITISDISGRYLFKKEYSYTSELSITIELHGLKIRPGIYSISMTNDKIHTSYKLIITD